MGTVAGRGVAVGGCVAIVRGIAVGSGVGKGGCAASVAATRASTVASSAAFASNVAWTPAATLASRSLVGIASKPSHAMPDTTHIATRNAANIRISAYYLWEIPTRSSFFVVAAGLPRSIGCSVPSLHTLEMLARIGDHHPLHRCLRDAQLLQLGDEGAA